MSELITHANAGASIDLAHSLNSKNWYAVYTRSNYEKRVATELSEKCIENFLPSVREVHQWKDRKREIEIPIFPGYVFVRIEDNDQTRLQILRTLGTVRILGYGSEIEPVPNIEIESVRQLLRAKVPFVAHPFLKAGAWVRVKRGPLQDVEGIFVRMKSQGRLVLSVKMLSQSVATEIDGLDIEVIRAAK